MTLQSVCGIDGHPYLGTSGQNNKWLQWTRCMMGLCSLPYVAIKCTQFADEMAFGDARDSKTSKAKCLQELQEELSSAMKLRFKPLVQQGGFSYSFAMNLPLHHSIPKRFPFYFG
jgi:hypothetical protein